MSSDGETPARRAVRQIPLLGTLLIVAVTYRLLNRHFGLPILLPGYVDLFAIGMALAVVCELGVGSRLASRSSGRAAIIFAAVALFATATRVEHDRLWTVAYPTLVGLSFALLVLVVRRERAGDRGRPRILSSRLLVALGTISYGVYLWHWTIVDAMYYGDLAWVRPHAFVLVAAVAFALAVTVATLSWLVLERSALRMKDRPVSQWLRWRMNPVTRPELFPTSYGD